MTALVIFVDRAFMPQGEVSGAAIVIEDTKIVAVGPRDHVSVPTGALRIDAAGLTATPGFVDVHIHGAGGHDVMEGTPDALGAVARTVAARGTTSLVATTVTASEDSTCRAVAAIASWIHTHDRLPQGTAPEAEILGIHFEGPFISPARRGVHPPEWISAPSVPLFEKFLVASVSTGRIVTLAPELSGALELIAAACEAGVVVSLGHTDANFAQATSAIASGARHAAHVFNAMRPF